MFAAPGAAQARLTGTATAAPIRTNAHSVSGAVGRPAMPTSRSNHLSQSRHASRLPPPAAGPPGGQMLVREFFQRLCAEGCWTDLAIERGGARTRKPSRHKTQNSPAVTVAVVIASSSSPSSSSSS